MFSRSGALGVCAWGAVPTPLLHVDAQTSPDAGGGEPLVELSLLFSAVRTKGFALRFSVRGTWCEVPSVLRVQQDLRGLSPASKDQGGPWSSFFIGRRLRKGFENLRSSSHASLPPRGNRPGWVELCPPKRLFQSPQSWYLRTWPDLGGGSLPTELVKTRSCRSWLGPSRSMTSVLAKEGNLGHRPAHGANAPRTRRHRSG